MTQLQKIVKRTFDICLALLGLLAFGWIIVICWIIASIDTKNNGFFIQRRIGQHGKPFNVIKIRSMRNIKGVDTTITTKDDPRISAIGGFFRSTKLDELPQLLNVLIGKMSFVGPRPDVPGYADRLTGKEKKILELRPGITGPASIYFKYEEEILSKQRDPVKYNNEVIWPQKKKINLHYLYNYAFWQDIRLILITVLGTEDKQLRNNIKTWIEY